MSNMLLACLCIVEAVSYQNVYCNQAHFTECMLLHLFNMKIIQQYTNKEK